MDRMKIAAIFADQEQLGGKAVSYTHLDVYKRQILRRCNGLYSLSDRFHP